jgi:uncharacterized protein (TIGR02217 family)
MSNAIFPSFKGLSWPVVKTPTFMTRVQKSVSGIESRTAYAAYPIYKFSLTFEFLSVADYHSLAGFFLQRQGMWDSFLFNDPSDNTVTAQQFGVGNGTSTQFQLVRAFNGTFAEPTQNINGTPTIYIDGVPTGAFTLNSTGVVTFSTPPALGKILTWTGQYYFRCRFDADAHDYAQVLSNFYEFKQLDLVGSPLNKIT